MLCFCWNKGPEESHRGSDLVSLKGTQSTVKSKRTVNHLHLSLNQEMSSYKMYQAIPENEVYMLGKEMPIFITIQPRNRKRSLSYSNGETLLPCDELIGSLVCNRLSKSEVVMNFRYDNPNFIKKLASLARMVVWSSEMTITCKLSAPNLKKIDDLEGYNKTEMLSIFDNMDQKVTFTMAPATKTIDYLFFVAFDKYINKSSICLPSLLQVKDSDNSHKRLCKKLSAEGLKNRRPLFPRRHLLRVRFDSCGRIPVSRLHSASLWRPSLFSRLL